MTKPAGEEDGSHGKIMHYSSYILLYQSENSAKRSPKSPNSHFYALGARRCKREAEEDVLKRQIRLRPKPGTLCEENTSFKARREYFFFNVEWGVYFRVGVAVVLNFEPALVTSC